MRAIGIALIGKYFLVEVLLLFASSQLSPLSNWEFVGEKCEHFFRLNVCIGFRVSSTFGQSDGCMSDTPETMGGLSGVPNGTSSQTI